MLALILTAALSAQADVHRAFVVSAGLDDVVAWSFANRGAIQEAMHASVIEHDTIAGTIRLVCRTPRGTFDLIVHERTRKGVSTSGVPMAIYTTDLVECPSRNVLAESVAATFWEVPAGTAVNIQVTIDVPAISKMGLSKGVGDALDRFQRLLAGRFR